tara:strand:+ start:492 stop:596 length:105 start_codon:yes stop_codon:yes gene_type:complete
LDEKKIEGFVVVLGDEYADACSIAMISLIVQTMA